MHLPPALVGAPAADLDVPRRPSDRDRGRALGVRRVRRGRARAGVGRARHLVLGGALAVRHPRLAGGHARACPLLPRRRQLDGPRDHPPLGEPDDLDRARDARRRPVHRLDHPLDGARAGRSPDVEESRHRHRSDAADRGVRGGRDAVRPAEDLLDAGRALLVRRDRGGPEARDQALERRATDPRRTPRASRRRSSRATSRSAGSSRVSTPPGPRSRTHGRASTSPSRRRRSTTSRSTTSATGTRRRSSLACTTATRRRSRPRSARSSGSSRSCTRCCPTSPRRSGRACRAALRG